MLVNLSTFTVFPQQATKNPLSPHPLNLGRHPGLSSTLPLTHACMPSLPLCSEEIASTSSRVDNGGLDNYSPILDELPDMRTRVCVADFWLFIGVKPDLTLADVFDGGGEPLLRTEVDHDLRDSASGGRSLGIERRVMAEFERYCIAIGGYRWLRGVDRVGRRSPG